MPEPRHVVEDVGYEINRGEDQTDAAPAPGNWAAIGGVAMFVCCLGHGLLLAFSAAGLAAAVGGAVGSPAVVIGAVIVVAAAAAAGALIALRLRRRCLVPAAPPSPEQ